MKKHILAATVVMFPAMLMAQSAINAYQLSTSELRGTARYMSMGGAFGALGGDLSVLRQNPAGIGVYRSSQIGVTLDIDFQKSKFTSIGQSNSMSQTKAACDNFGYVGAARLTSEVMPYFQWGISYSRALSFDRVYSGMIPALGSSITNYMAATSDGYLATSTNPLATGQLLGDENYDPFNPPAGGFNVPWMSALAYNTYMINPVTGSPDTYNGLWQNGTTGNASINVRERGYMDEYSFNFGGNFVNSLYWGIGIGVTSLSFTQESYYDESLSGARIVNHDAKGTQTGSADIGLENYMHADGSGVNLKFGLIYKPINEFRIGLAVHTPTWYHLTYTTGAWANYNYTGQFRDASGQMLEYNYNNLDNNDNAYDYTDYGQFNSRIRTPWRMLVSAAGVIGGRAIISADYEYEAYPSMTVGDEYGKFDYITNDVKNYYQSTNTLRLGAELRVTPQFSVRAGYSYKSSPAKSDAYNNRLPIDTRYNLNCNPMYTFDNSQQYITFGLGYQTGGFSIDAAYVHKHRESSWSAFTAYENGINVPAGKITDNNNHLVLSVAYRF